MIWYLNGTFPTKQPRGLLIQGWHYLMLLVGIASQHFFLVLFRSLQVSSPFRNPTVSWNSTGFIPIGVTEHPPWSFWICLVETIERSWRSFIAWITSVMIIWLVVSTNPSEKYEFVSWEYYSQNKSHVPNHQPVILAAGQSPSPNGTIGTMVFTRARSEIDVHPPRKRYSWQ